MFKTTWPFLMFVNLPQPPPTFQNLSELNQTFQNLSEPVRTYLNLIYGVLNKSYLWLHHIEMPTGRQIIKEPFGKRWKYDLVGMEKNIKHWDS